MRAPREIYAAVYRHLRSSGRVDARARGFLAALAAELELPAEAAREAEQACDAARRAAFASPEGPVDLETLSPSEPTVLDVGEALCAVALSPDGLQAAAASLDHKVYLFELASGHRVGAFAVHDQDVNGVAWLDDRSLVSVADGGEVVRWEAPSGEVAWRADVHSEEASAVAVSPTGDRVASGGWDRKVALLDPDDGAVLQILPARDRVNAVAFSADGARVAAGVYQGVQAWAVDGGAEQPRFEVPDREVLAVAFAPTGGVIAIGDSGGRVVLVDLDTSRALRELPGHDEPVTSVAFAAEGRLLVSGGEDDLVRLWDVASGQLLASLDAETGAVRGVAASLDGHLILCVGDGGDGTYGGREGVRVWRQ